VSAPHEVSAFLAFLERYKASSPTDATVYWVSLKPKALAALFFKESGYQFSHSFIKHLLKDLGFGYRKLSKHLAIGTYADRDKQFQIIFQLVALMSVKSPVLSIDCKKKERLGNLYRDGKSYCTAPIKVYDHDYDYLGEGKVIPHGIYDMQRNEGYITIGNSHETAEFIKDNLLWWWLNYGQFFYTEAKNMLILCDAGGANGHRHHVFKKEMQELSKTIGLDIIICHYPPYASKWNPIEHRLFAHVHQTMQGVVLSDYNLVKELIQHTTTKTGLKVEVRINSKQYQIGMKTSKEQVCQKRIQFNKIIPNLSYRIAA
jgi:hypothetical protein